MMKRMDKDHYNPGGIQKQFGVYTFDNDIPVIEKK